MCCRLQVINGSLYVMHNVQMFYNSQLIARLWDMFLGPAGLGPVPRKMSFQYGAEFLLKKSRILLRPKKFYLKALAFLLESTRSGVFNEYNAGAAFERIWHFIFGEEAFSDTLAISHCALYDCQDTAT